MIKKSLKKYLFIFYVLSFVLPLFDSIYLVVTRRKIVYAVHFFLSFYTLFLVCYFYLRKLMKVKTRLYNYGGK